MEVSTISSRKITFTIPGKKAPESPEISPYDAAVPVGSHKTHERSERSKASWESMQKFMDARTTNDSIKSAGEENEEGEIAESISPSKDDDYSTFFRMEGFEEGYKTPLLTTADYLKIFSDTKYEPTKLETIGSTHGFEDSE